MRIVSGETLGGAQPPRDRSKYIAGDQPLCTTNPLARVTQRHVFYPRKSRT